MKLLQNMGGLLRHGLAVLGVIGLAAGCATRAPRPAATPIFYPPPPDAPRLQFLTSITSSDDVGDRNTLLDFLIGRRPARYIGKPYGVTVTRGRIYVSDTSPATVEILDLGKKKWRYFSPGGGGRFVLPTNLAIDRDGTLYVADAGRGQVLIFGPDERFLGAIGTRQEAKALADMGAGEPPQRAPKDEKEEPIVTATPMKPSDIAIVGDRLYIADALRHSVRVFDKRTRQQLLVITVDRQDATAKLYTPTNLDVDQAGRIYVTDTGGFMVMQYDADGKYLRSFGRQGDQPGEFVRPKGIAVDRAGRVYVVEAAAQVVQVFDAEGRLLMYFGQPVEAMGENKNARGLLLPAGIAIDYENVARFQKYVAPGSQLEYLVFVVSQYGPNKINVYGLLQPR
ncbi:MAG: 6-bladed beta-propeller [Kiritimatiellaeota bacterium]|nr:6-bladed beta-propeller [Kiritimatiellota bacterium]